ncbi:MAG: DUF1348 family protein [Nitrospira sp.]|nr:DUF1348 family protein [Nitrospira sp.]
MEYRRPGNVLRALTLDCPYRNRSEFLSGREATVWFLRRKLKPPASTYLQRCP